MRRLVAWVAMAALLTTAAATSASASPAPMKQTKQYQFASMASLAPAIPFVAIGLDDEYDGACCLPFGEPASFRVPTGARSARIWIVDDAGVEVRGFVRGDLASGHDYHYYAICATPRKVLLAKRARALLVYPDAGYYGSPRVGYGIDDSDPCPLPVSLPTEGTITVSFSRHR